MMRSIHLIGTVLLLAGATIAASLVHGQMTNRWGQRVDSRLAVERLKDQLPEQVGNWRLRRESELEESVVRILQCPAYISRIYEHQQTGDIISVAVLLGPPGPISVHTPEICYSSHDYTITSERQKRELVDAAGNAHSLWEVNLQANGSHANRLRVLYGWSTGEVWSAAEYPRYGYGGGTHLYKLQLAGLMDRQQREDFNPAEDFLDSFLVQLQERLVKASM